MKVINMMGMFTTQPNKSAIARLTSMRFVGVRIPLLLCTAEQTNALPTRPTKNMTTRKTQERIRTNSENIASCAVKQ